jgi:hypothetical protein
MAWQPIQHHRPAFDLEARHVRGAAERGAGLGKQERRDQPARMVVEPRGLQEDDIRDIAPRAPRISMHVDLHHQSVENSSPQAP